jgi:energy-coupling factor transporter ATP-binding protein EcfA2
MIEDEINKLISVVGKFKPGAKLKHYISYAQFPSFKGLEPGTRIEFGFPLTALVGPNGVGKSSVLHALWGMPYGQSTSKFWFETDLDPIVGTQRYFYSYWHEPFGGFVESRKARVGTKKADYWEPARLSIPDGMKPLPAGDFIGKAKDRWNPVRRDVVYINLKTSFGSFDRFFYFDDDVKADERRVVMLQEARRLRSIVEQNRQSYTLGNRERIFVNRELTLEEIEAVSEILGRAYESARYIEHALYPGRRGKDISVIFRRGASYSEAFAGSGELTAVNAVVQILGAPDYSLILLDEPETSLHPGAQRALLKFLLEQIKKKGHQIVISTHSIDLLQGLPHAAIKVFEGNGTGQTRVLPSSSPNSALVRLGKPPITKKRVLVEDRMAALLIERAINSLDPGDIQSLEIKVAPGGADAILRYLGPAAMTSGDDVYVFLDGDQRKVEEFTDPNTIAPAAHPQLGALLKVETGVEPLFHIPGGQGVAAHELAKVQAHLNYLTWLRARVDYLPGVVPEVTFLKALNPAGAYDALTAAEAKDALRTKLANDVEVTSSEIVTLAKVAAAGIPQDHENLAAIRQRIAAWLHGAAI